jgi:hypothetical protein
MLSNNGNYEKDIVRFPDKPYEVSCTGENVVAVTIYNKHKTGTTMPFCNRNSTKCRNIFHKRFQF